MLSNKFWAKYFRVYDTLNYLIPYRELVSSLVDELRLGDNLKILDAGAGTGNITMAIVGVNKKVNVWALDSCLPGLTILKNKIQHEKIEMINHDLTLRLPFPDNYFDRIISNNVLYAISPSQRKSVMKEFNRIMKKNGILVVSNVKSGWSPMKIYSDHIKKEYGMVGAFGLLWNLIKFLIPTIKMFYYNFIVLGKSGRKTYNFMNESEQKALFDDAAFKLLTPVKYVYSEQAILTSGKKYE